MKKIFIDAGHNNSGGDTGAEGNGYKEQDITFQVSKLVGELLKQQGLDIKYSRNNQTDNLGTDVPSSINARVGMANSWQADYFISIHCNAFEESGANGTETLVYGFSGARYELAKKVQAEIVNTLGTTNRGVKERTNLGVLNNTKMPAIIIELAFITNINDCEKLIRRQSDFAKAICKGICNYLNIQFAEVIPVPEPHWAQKHLDSLVAKGLVETPAKWQEFDNPVTKGLVLALVDKATSKI